MNMLLQVVILRLLEGLNKRKKMLILEIREFTLVIKNLLMRKKRKKREKKKIGYGVDNFVHLLRKE